MIIYHVVISILKISDTFQSIDLALQSHPLQCLQKPPHNQTLKEICLNFIDQKTTVAYSLVFV